MILRLRQNLELSRNIFVELKLDLEFFVRREEGRELGFRINLFKEAKRRKGVGLEITCPIKGEGE